MVEFHEYRFILQKFYKVLISSLILKDKIKARENKEKHLQKHVL